MSCSTCQRNGVIILNWEKYLSAETAEELEQCEVDCPDCDGLGITQGAEG